MRVRATVLVLALVLAAAMPSGATSLDLLTAQAASQAAAESSVAIEHLANLKHRLADGTELGGGGSDLEFVELDVSGLQEEDGADTEDETLAGGDATETLAADGELAGAGTPGKGKGKGKGRDKPKKDIRRFALAGTIDLPDINAGLQIIDITDPAVPVPVAVWDCRVSQGDIQVFTREVEGVTRTYVGYGADYSAVRDSACFEDLRAMGRDPGNGLGTWFVDITNPYEPVTAGFAAIGTGSHNLTIHPSGDYLYNSSNRITAAVGALEIVDISDLANPQPLPSLDLGTGIDAHDVTFNADGTRAYVAAVNHTLIVDTTDPAAPEIIGRVINAAATIHHQSDPVTIDHPVLGERTFLVITDEFGGAAGNAFCPGGGLIIYDITGDLETAPVFVGAWFIPQVEPLAPSQRAGRGSLGVVSACTSHVLRFHPEEAIMTIGWYSAGVRVVDLSSLVGVSVGAVPELGDTGQSGVGMRELGYFYFDDSNAWSAKTPEITVDEDGSRSFYLYANDIQRGFDVFHFDESAGSATADPGTWMSPAQYTAYKAALPGGDGGLQPWCALRAVQQG